MSTIRADLSHYYPAKALFERILGKDAFLRVKDFGSLSDWKLNYQKLLRAIEVSAAATVEVCDDEWRDQLHELVAQGTARVKAAKFIDVLHADVAATLGELAFFQLGYVPSSHAHQDRVPLIPQRWRLDPVRSVQYVQSLEQRATQERLRRNTESGGGARCDPT
jgi:hypothetical protein